MTRFARRDEVGMGTRLIADAGFSCLLGGAVVEVRCGLGGLYVPCAHGRHYLDGSLNAAGEYVGFSTVQADAG